MAQGVAVREAPVEEPQAGGLWAGDVGTLPFDVRRVLLRLVSGPFIAEDRESGLWKTLMNNRRVIASRLNDLFLDLVVDETSGIAFVRNVAADDLDTPKAVHAQTLTLLDTAMVLTLRRELLNSGFERAIVSREDIVAQMALYRPIARLDEAGFAKKLTESWNRLDEMGILQRTSTEDRWEISPVLRLIFSAEEANAVREEFEALLADEASEGEAGEGEAS